MVNEVKQKGKIVWVRIISKETGKPVDVAHWISDDDMYAIEKENPMTGEWERVIREVEP